MKKNQQENPTDLSSNNVTTKVAKAGLSTTNKILIGGFTLLTVAVIVVAAIFFIKSNKNNSLPVTNGNLIIDENNLDDVNKQIQESVQDGMYRVRMNRDWEFPDGTTASTNAYVANSDTNTKSVYVDVTINGTNETVYKSSVIPVGSALKEIKLDTDLAKGYYEGVCTYHLLDDEMNELSSVSLVVTLNVLN